MMNTYVAHKNSKKNLSADYCRYFGRKQIVKVGPGKIPSVKKLLVN